MSRIDCPSLSKQNTDTILLPSIDCSEKLSASLATTMGRGYNDCDPIALSHDRFGDNTVYNRALIDHDHDT